jgi:hypothetical protein
MNNTHYNYRENQILPVKLSLNPLTLSLFVLEDTTDDKGVDLFPLLLPSILNLTIVPSFFTGDTPTRRLLLTILLVAIG